jgi:hypothetical protein
MTSLLQKINDLDIRIDNISTSGGGGATTIADVENLQSSLDAKQSTINDLVTEGFITAGDNITFSTFENNTTISSTAGGSEFIGMRVWKGSSSLTINGGATLPYNIIDFINGISYDNTSTYKATILTAGKYCIGFACYNVNNITGVVDIRVNQTTTRARFGERFPNICIITGATLLDLVENDTVSIVCDNGQVRVFGIPSQPNYQSTYFYIFKIA